MLFELYTRYKGEEERYHGIVDVQSEHIAMIRAYHMAADVYAEHDHETSVSSFFDFHDQLFSLVDFWIIHIG